MKERIRMQVKMTWEKSLGFGWLVGLKFNPKPILTYTYSYSPLHSLSLIQATRAQAQKKNIKDVSYFELLFSWKLGL